MFLCLNLILSPSAPRLGVTLLLDWGRERCALLTKALVLSGFRVAYTVTELWDGRPASFQATHPQVRGDINYHLSLDCTCGAVYKVTTVPEVTWVALTMHLPGVLQFFVLIFRSMIHFEKIFVKLCSLCLD